MGGVGGCGGPVIRPEIALSWKRSELSGVDPAGSYDARPSGDVDPASRLLRAARPVLDEIGVQIAGTELCVLLADPGCRIVARVFDNPAVERQLELLGVTVGSRFGEDHAGTNALGTPLEVRRGVVVNGPEHYLEQFKNLSCYGHPIIHPVTRRVEGILDLTCIGPQVNSLFAPFLQRAAGDIEHRLLEGARASQRRLVDAFQRVSPQRQVAVAAVADDLLLSNHAAQEMLDAADHAALRGLAADLRPDQSRTARVELVSGEAVSVRVERIAGADGGTLFQVEPVHRDTIPVPRTATPSAGGRIRSELERARGRDVPVAILGEPGSGRTSAARDVLGSGDARWFDASRIAVQGTKSWIAGLARCLQAGTPVVIEQVQLLPESAHPLVADALAGTEPRVVVTACPDTDLPRSVAALIARCPERITLPPLRNRRAEVPDIARSMLAGIASGSRLTASALAALGAASWPGNLAELKVVLTAAADRMPRSGGRITLSDLPEQYRASGRVSRLGGRERAERQAIVDALAECSGNKVHAAAQLGISRSTLYTRMRALEITT
ncbi:sigma-54-dependent Fis family transcriptional regulator [Rhodococcus sp. NPDC058532]|uniref:sigma-54-dependent Fis family transcriptional regulator n=1 Tax=Rhodococcus sp. NPDC058532 TaxID=3346540 RepID=UPI0036547FDA